jgi:hypothetical protein
MHPAYKSRDVLRTEILQAFAHHEEVSHIFFFGKEVEGIADEYSDIDMVICSDDMPRTQNSYRQTFAQISPIRNTWLITSSLDHFAEMIMLEAYSPYQKIDFSIVKDIQDKAQFGPFHCVYERPTTGYRPPSSPNVLQEISVIHDITYILTEVLFSVGRFTKCLFRQDFQKYRRWHGLAELTIVLLFEKYFGWVPEMHTRRLMSHEVAKLYNTISADDFRTLTTIYPQSGPVNIVQSYQVSLDLCILLSQQKARALGCDLDMKFIDYARDFFQKELARHQQFTEQRKRGR